MGNVQDARREMTKTKEQRVLQEGPVRGTKNPSAVLMSRIGRVRRENTTGSSDAPRKYRSCSRGGSPGRGRSPDSGGGGRRHSRSCSKDRSKSKSKSRQHVSPEKPPGPDDASGGPGLGPRVIPPRDFVYQQAGFVQAGGMS